MPSLTLEALPQLIENLRTTPGVDGPTLDAVRALLTSYGLLDGVTIEEAAHQLGVNTDRVRKWVSQENRLNGSVFGTGRRAYWVVERASVERLAAQRAASQAAYPCKLGRPRTRSTS